MSATPSVTSATSTPLTSAPTSPLLSPSKAQQEDSILSAIESRRTIYALNKDLPISTARLHSILSRIAVASPSAFNSQTTRTIVLTSTAHTHYWNLVLSTLRAIQPASQFAATEARINGFLAAHSTVLFYVDPTKVKELQAAMPKYAAKFPVWAAEASAMQQFAVWTALEAEGAGANLQHYGELVDGQVKERWHLPESWEVSAQLVVGGRVESVTAEKKGKGVEELMFWHEE